ncbi:glycoside hydrolase family 13 protein [Streptomyces sp. DSM 41699]|uniref:Glycoside hydrolase family 13 protein n=2 Tax=Streptomyces gibsoniae TaxID=3075529 RepID=A0ABU2TW86_9ACTN|nr:glycoside hydrolase family 13 protein [Streptomyces sp. DSM 41699]MDT0465145.1 glycoside hydrolase family 13 protein [Streptomyces sp. DSM 41699]
MSGTPDDAASVPGPAKAGPGTDEEGRPDTAAPWWRDAVCYEIYPRSFADSDGDGTGDLPGATARLEHLRSLGVDAVWITPFYPSPLADGGYDIADHTAVACDLGSTADFDALVQRAHTLDLKVLIDLVPNHTSDQHPWFREAAAAGPGSRARQRYVFRPGRGANGELPPNDWQSAFGGPAWTRVGEPDGSPGEWYLHLHAPEQPDLNWRDHEVVTDFERILKHWLDLGVDGFRIDVAHTLFKAEGLPDAGPGQHQDIHRNHLMPYYDQDELHPLFRNWRALLDSHPAPPGAVPPRERVMVAETGIFERERLARYVRPGEMQQTFNFAFLECPWDGKAMRDVIEESVGAMQAVGAPVTWVLSSHDAVRPVTRYGGGRIGERRARAAALLMLALPGASYVYQGEELGLPQVQLPDDRLRDPLWERSGHHERGRDGCRVPLPWQGDTAPYGFSTAAPEDCWFPQPAHWAGLTATAQENEADSVLALYRRALQLRRAHPAADAVLKLDGPHSSEWFGFERGPGLRCVVNFGAQPLSLDDDAEVLLSSAPVDGRSVPQDTAVWMTYKEKHSERQAQR